MFKENEKVEYAAHPVSWQAGHNETDVPWHLADGREPILTSSVTEKERQKVIDDPSVPDGIEPIVEDWRPATVISVMEHPAMPHLNKFEPDVVVKLQPNDGGVPFDLNAKLVRKAN